MAETLPVLLLTRPRLASEHFARALEEEGLRFRAVISPLISIVVTGPLPDDRRAKGLIFTSANGVSAWLELGGRVDLPVYAVGRATAHAARAAGMTAISADGTVDELFGWLTARRPKTPLLHLHGVHVRGTLAEMLTKEGLPCRSAAIYDQPAQDLTAEARAALAGDLPVVVPVFSPRTAKLLAREHANAPLLVAAMSEAVVNALSPLHKQELIVAQRPESEEMKKAVARLLSQARDGAF
ncbi:uroporphyrinogen-III synthase [Antarctobacter jejuensis]|uniref:uroporphyrinogen-III synthase n=1 Tax=Antarctobacter jejuensis TaxID=1439938 RepID=UPI003FD04CD3